MNVNVTDRDAVNAPHVHKQFQSSIFYRSKFPEGIGFEAFEDIPLTTKQELRSTKVTDLLAVDRTCISHYHESSGTTGTPSSSWFTRDDIIRNGQQINTSGIHLQANDLVLIRFPYALFLPAFLIQEASYQAGAGIIHASSRNNVTTYPKVLHLMNELEVTIFAGMPRELELLAEVARLLDYDIKEKFPHLSGIWVAGELLGPNRKRHLEQLWGVPVINLYGSTETGNIATMCDHGTLHYAVDEFYIEVLDTNSNSPMPVAERGRAVITTLQHEASPLLRYENGDIVAIQPSNCACGSTNHEIHHYGRMSERIDTGEKILDHYDIQEAIYSLNPVPVAWSVQERHDFYELILEYNDEQETDVKAIHAFIKKTLGQSFQCTFVNENTLLNCSDLLVYESSRKPQYISKCNHSPIHIAYEAGVEQFMAGNYTKAAELLQEIIKQDTKHADAHALLAACLGKMIGKGNLLHKVMQLPQLKRTAQTAVQLNEFSSLARGVWGLVLLKTPEDFGGNVRRALKELKLSVYLGSQDPDVWTHIAEAYMKLEQYINARNAIQKALQLQPESVEAHKLLINLNKKG